MKKDDQYWCDKFHADRDEKACSDYERALPGIQLEIEFPNCVVIEYNKVNANGDIFIPGCFTNIKQYTSIKDVQK